MQMSAKTDKETDGLQAMLASIVSQTAPDAQHAFYHARHLELMVYTLEGQPARYMNLSFTLAAKALLAPSRSPFCARLVHQQGSKTG